MTDHLELAQPAPAWFQWACAQPLDAHRVEVEGCPVNYLSWDTAEPDSRERPGILFVHGGGAHAMWWRFVAPFFVQDYRVVAIDLSGMGDSGHRAEYSMEVRAAELEAVRVDAGLGHHSYIVGHSLGGFITMCYGAELGKRIAGAVIVDSPILRAGSPPIPEPPRLVGAHRVYPTLDEALTRFRVLPSQPCENDYLLEFIARHSLRAVEGGWQWKFDPLGMSPRRFGEPFRRNLESLMCRGALMFGEKSALVSQETARYMSELMGPAAPLVAIPEAHHHVMLDQPLAFVAALRTLLDTWVRSYAGPTE